MEDPGRCGIESSSLPDHATFIYQVKTEKQTNKNMYKRETEIEIETERVHKPER